MLGGVLLTGFAASAGAQTNVYVFEESTITGTIEKPEAFYILQPTNLDYQSLEAEASFLERLYRTVEAAPFAGE
ncbi:MAG: hypothetical protein H6699_00605 [Myxococcales bacterium]|nr:hypothetical protein [Myxococcales bacterium]